MRVVLARHGDAVNSDGKFHGMEDKPLSSKGREEVYKLAKELKQYNASIIYYCPTVRTTETAKILSDELGIVRKKVSALHPLDLGNFVGKNIDDYLESVRHYLANPEEKIPGGQSVNDWAAQYLPFFEKYFRNKSKQAIIFVTHGRNILLSKAYIKKGALAPAFDKDVLLESKKSTEHGGYALATPPNNFEIVHSHAVKAGQS